jgi:hypothetical protein
MGSQLARAGHCAKNRSKKHRDVIVIFPHCRDRMLLFCNRYRSIFTPGPTRSAIVWSNERHLKLAAVRKIWEGHAVIAI